jgi:hypothetical protein
MATPADQRLLDLLDKWLLSLELHLKYSSLDDDSYSQVQPWPEHQRPSRWIIDLARQKALALRAQVQERVKAGDHQFSDSLELMTFLANLVGAEHIERFIPLAAPDTERELTRSAAAVIEATAPAAPTAAAEAAVPAKTVLPAKAVVPAKATARAPPTTSADSATGTREMPKFVGGRQRAPPESSTAHVARAERKAEAAAPHGKPVARAGAKPVTPMTPAPAKAAVKPAAARADTPGPERALTPEAARDQVIADAARLVQWGRKWYELAELIARMADRPTLTDVRRILKDNKTAIEKKAGRD